MGPEWGKPFTDETLDKIVDLLRPDYIQGLTLTGGDPLLPENREVVEKIVHRVWTEFLSKKMFGSGLDTSGKNYGIRMES